LFVNKLKKVKAGRWRTTNNY